MSIFETRKAFDMGLLSASSKVHIVLGNQSCDLDSAVSALCYAFLLDSENECETLPVLPVLNICREEFPLRTEVCYLFGKYRLPCNQLIFRDDVDLQSLCTAGILQLTLVDHHVMPEEDKILQNCVMEVLDHRPRDQHQIFPQGCKVDIRTVGSCASLITEQILLRAPELLDAQIGILLSGTVLLDTACFSPEADRTAPLDVAMVKACESRVGVPKHRTTIFQELVDARKDVSNLTSFQLLHKDMKVVRGVPLPGLPLLVTDFLSRSDAPAALSAFCVKHNSKAAVVMGMCFASGYLKRDLLVYSTISTQDLAKKLTEALCNNETLGLRRISHQAPGVSLFDQTNIKASRKQVLPIVQAVLDQL